MCDTKANLAYEISVLIAQMTLCAEMSKGVAKWWVTSPATEIQRQVPDRSTAHQWDSCKHPVSFSLHCELTKNLSINAEDLDTKTLACQYSGYPFKTVFIIQK